MKMPTATPPPTDVDHSARISIYKKISGNGPEYTGVIKITKGHSIVVKAASSAGANVLANQWIKDNYNGN